ncbi:hypothetical protein QCA50_007953 [Cerrena zonata]|uniref:Myb/SANT-like domain-containing protein n=1 Tax=Cerrena zonata TaxID=2478898 RepID=A0AAW0GH49_9APHY
MAESVPQAAVPTPDPVNAVIIPDVAGQALWKPADDLALVNALAVQKAAGLQSDSGFKTTVWTYVSKAVWLYGQRLGGTKTSDKCKEHFRTLKGHYSVVKELWEASGFGWNDVEKKVTATDDVWKDYIAKHSKATMWQTWAFPLYDKIDSLVFGVVAMGANAYHPGQTTSDGSPSPSSTLINDSSSSSENSNSNLGSASTSRCCQRADSDLQGEGLSNSRDAHPHVRPCTADAMSAMAASLQAVSQSLSSPPPDSSPSRRRRATKMLIEDQTFDSDTEEDVLNLFVEDSASIDIFMELPTAEKRARFIRRRLQK